MALIFFSEYSFGLPVHRTCRPLRSKRLRMQPEMELSRKNSFAKRDQQLKSFSSRAWLLITRSIATSCSSNARICFRGTAFGPSDIALAGSGWVSMNRPPIPTATAARASTGTNSRCPPELAPLPPGSCTLWVASNTTGAPVWRMIASERMSETRGL